MALADQVADDGDGAGAVAAESGSNVALLVSCSSRRLHLPTWPDTASSLARQYTNTRSQSLAPSGSTRPIH